VPPYVLRLGCWGLRSFTVTLRRGPRFRQTTGRNWRPARQLAPFERQWSWAMFDGTPHGCYDPSAGWSSLVARWAHNPKVGGSNPPPATKTSFWFQWVEPISQTSSVTLNPDSQPNLGNCLTQIYPLPVKGTAGVIRLARSIPRLSLAFPFLVRLRLRHHDAETTLDALLIRSSLPRHWLAVEEAPANCRKRAHVRQTSVFLVSIFQARAPPG
jgi:hypothetical protein